MFSTQVFLLKKVWIFDLMTVTSLCGVRRFFKEITVGYAFLNRPLWLDLNIRRHLLDQTILTEFCQKCAPYCLTAQILFQVSRSPPGSWKTAKSTRLCFQFVGAAFITIIWLTLVLSHFCYCFYWRSEFTRNPTSPIITAVRCTTMHLCTGYYQPREA